MVAVVVVVVVVAAAAAAVVVVVVVVEVLVGAGCHTVMRTRTCLLNCPYRSCLQ